MSKMCYKAKNVRQVVKNVRHGAKNVHQGAKNVSHGTENVRHGAENVRHGAENLTHGAKNDIATSRLNQPQAHSVKIKEGACFFSSYYHTVFP